MLEVSDIFFRWCNIAKENNISMSKKVPLVIEFDDYEIRGVKVYSNVFATCSAEYKYFFVIIESREVKGSDNLVLLEFPRIVVDYYEIQKFCNFIQSTNLTKERNKIMEKQKKINELFN